MKAVEVLDALEGDVSFADSESMSDFVRVHGRKAHDFYFEGIQDNGDYATAAFYVGSERFRVRVTKEA